MDFACYTPYLPSNVSPVSSLSRQEARAEYDNLLRSIPTRMLEFQYLVGEQKKLSYDLETVFFLNKLILELAEESKVVRTEPSARSYSMVQDLCLFLCEFVLHVVPTAKYTFFTSSKRHDRYQALLVQGTNPQDGSKHEFNPFQTGKILVERVVAGYREKAISAFESKVDTFCYKCGIDLGWGFYLETQAKIEAKYKRLFPSE